MIDFHGNEFVVAGFKSTTGEGKSGSDGIDGLSMEQLVEEPILIVDDKEENLYSLQKVLEKEQFSVVTARSGMDALRYLLKHDVSLILIDVQMPEMNGFETVQEIRQNARHQDVPIVFITAVFRSDDFIDYGYSVGAYDYLTKPIDNRLLSNKVRLFQTLHLQRKALELSHNRLLDESKARKAAEAREQFSAYQAGIAEMTTSVIHNIGNSVQGLDGAFFELKRSSNQLELLKQGLQQAVKEWDKVTESGGDGTENEQRLLNYIRELPELIQDSILEPFEHPSEVIEKSIYKISEIIHAQRVGGYTKKLYQHFSAQELVDDIKIILKEELLQAPAQLHSEVAAGVPELFLPRNPLLQNLMQLVKNSIDAIQKRSEIEQLERGEGVIQLKISMVGEQLKLELIDNGEGLDPKKSDDYFKYGYSSRSGQAGVGLHMVGNFVTSCRGNIVLDQSDITGGARVVLLLPLSDSTTLH